MPLTPVISRSGLPRSSAPSCVANSPSFIEEIVKEKARVLPASCDRRAKAEAIAVWIGDCKFAHAPRLIHRRCVNRGFWPQARVQASCAKRCVALVYTIHENAIDRTEDTIA